MVYRQQKNEKEEPAVGLRGNMARVSFLLVRQPGVKDTRYINGIRDIEHNERYQRHQRHDRYQGIKILGIRDVNIMSTASNLSEASESSKTSMTSADIKSTRDIEDTNDIKGMQDAEIIKYAAKAFTITPSKMPNTPRMLQAGAILRSAQRPPPLPPLPPLPYTQTKSSRLCSRPKHTTINIMHKHDTYSVVVNLWFSDCVVERRQTHLSYQAGALSSASAFLNRMPRPVTQREGNARVMRGGILDVQHQGRTADGTSSNGKLPAEKTYHISTDMLALPTKPTQTNKKTSSSHIFRAFHCPG